MRQIYHRNSKISIYGAQKDISTAVSILDTLDGIEEEIVGYRLKGEGAIRLIVQDAIDKHNIKATIYIDGNTVYPFAKIIKEYERLKKIGTLEKMSNGFYNFLHLNFDIAHYDKNGYIGYYGNDFYEMKKAVLDHASIPDWYTDLRHILNYIQGLSTSAVA